MFFVSKNLFQEKKIENLYNYYWVYGNSGFKYISLD